MTFALPSTITDMLPLGVSICKSILILTIVMNYSKAKFQPFTRSIYHFAAAGAVSKIAFFFLAFANPATKTSSFSGLDALVATAQDLSFVLPLVGVVITTSLDFLWALSSTCEDDPIFNRNISDVSFVHGWTKMQIPICVVLAIIRHTPTSILPLPTELMLQSAINLTLVISFGFVWYCLYKVHGKSNSEEFKKAFRNASIVNFLLSSLVAQNMVMLPPLFKDPLGKAPNENYLQMQHFLENIGIAIMIAYFMVIKASPSDLRTQKTTAAGLAGVLKAKTMFKRQKSDSKNK